MVKVGRGRRVLKAARGFVDFEPPPEGLTPVGNGFYSSPDVVAVNDCDWYPDSPMCGGNPITRTPIALGAGLSIDPCAITLSFAPVIGFVALPQRAIAWKPPGECRKEDPPEPAPEITPLGSPPSSSGFNRGIDDNAFVYAGINYIISSYSAVVQVRDENGKIVNYPHPDVEDNPIISVQGIGRRIYPVDDVYIASAGDNRLPVEVKYESTESHQGSPNAGSSSTEGYYSSHDDDTSRITFNANTGRVYRIVSFGGVVEEENKNVPPPYATIYQGAQFTSDSYMVTHISYGRWKDLKTYYLAESSSDAASYFIASCFGVYDPSKSPYKNNPPAPYLPRDCCMQCCSPTNNDALLDEILQIVKRLDKNVGKWPTNITIFDSNEAKPEAQPKTISVPNLSSSVSRIVERIEKISKIIGVDEFPITVPDTVLDESADDNWAEKILDWITPNKERKITSVMQYLDWLSDNISAVDGKWPPVIEVQDADATTPGDQKKKVILFDKATATRELVIQNIQNYKLIGLIMDMVFKLLVEMASTKQEVVKAKLIVDEISQYLGYGTRQKSVDLGIQISPQGEPIEESIPDGASPDAVAAIDKGNKDRKAAANSLAAWLEPSKVKIPYGDWDGEVSLWEQFQHLATLISQQGQK